MARARNIKPGFFTNDDLVDLPFEVRLLFIGLWTIADKEGRLTDRPKKIKMEIFPGDSVDVDAALNQLADKGFLRRYVVSGAGYIQIVNWHKHQNPHIKEAASVIPEENGAAPEIPVQAPEIPEQAGLIPDSLQSDSLNRIPDSQKPAKAGESYSPEFEEAWNEYPSRPGASKKESFKAWNARLKAGCLAEDMLDGVRRYAAYVRAMKTEAQYIKQPATFFGPDEHFKADWRIPPSQASPRQTKQDKAKDLADRLTGRTRNEPNHTIIDITPSAAGVVD